MYVQIFSLLPDSGIACLQLPLSSIARNRTKLKNRNSLLLINTFYLTIHFVKILQNYQHQIYIFRHVRSWWTQRETPSKLESLLRLKVIWSEKFSFVLFFCNSRRTRIKRSLLVLLIMFPPRHFKRRLSIFAGLFVAVGYGRRKR